MNVSSYIGRHDLSEEGQIALINRGYHEEIEQYLQKSNLYNGAIIKLIERGNHDEIIQLLMKHSGKMQEKAEKLLFERDVNAEINFYIKFYPISDCLIYDMFDKIEKGGNADRLFFYFWHHGIPIGAERRLINVPNSEVLFSEYVKRHSISFEAHVEMVEKRKPEEVRFYIENHKVLEPKAEEVFFAKASKEDKMFYIDVCKRPDAQIVNCLFNVRPIDYDVLAFALVASQDYLKCDTPLSSISFEDVENKVKNGKELSNSEVVALFFFDKPELLEAYLCEHKVEF